MRQLKKIFLGILLFTTLAYAQKFDMGINVAPVTYYSSEFPFKDVGRMMDIRDENGRNRVYTLWDLQGHIPAGDYVLFYDGTGNIDSWSSNITVKSSEAGRIVITVDPYGGAGISFLYDKTITNVRIILPGYEDSYQTDIFMPDFINKWKGFKTVRFMDWASTNGIEHTNWSDRAKLTDPTWSSDVDPSMPNIHGTVPWEVCIDFANKIGADAWINIPHKATDDYVQQLANLVNSRLNTGKKVYIEYSNECWNPMFEQYEYCNQKGKALGLDNDEWTAGRKYYSKRSVEIFDIFTNTLDASRVVRVMAAQGGNSWVGRVELEYNNAKNKTDALAVDLYFGYEYGNGSFANQVKTWTLDQLFDDIQTNPSRGIAFSKKNWINNKSMLSDIGASNIPILCYEGGQHLVGVGPNVDDEQLTNLFISANRHPRMKETLIKLFNEWNNISGGMVVYYSSCTPYSKWGSFGATEWNDETNTPKYNALLEWIGIALDTIAPSAPTGLNAVPNASGKIYLNWYDNNESDLFGYNLKRSTNSGGPYSTVASGVSKSEYTDGKIKNDTTYYYVVTAVDYSNNESGLSNEVSAEAISDSTIIVDFEDLPGGNIAGADPGIPYYDDKGFSFTDISGGNTGGLQIWTTNEGYDSNVLVGRAWNTIIRVTKTDSRPFDLISFDYSSSQWGEQADAKVTAYFTNGTIDSSSYVATLQSNQTLTLNWNELDSVLIDFNWGTDASFGGVDNFIFADNTTGVEKNNENIPEAFSLSQNYPNPFNPDTNISYQIPSRVLVKIKIYDILGKEVQTLIDKEQLKGKYRVNWNGNNSSGKQVASGVYFIYMQAGEFSSVKKITLLR